MAWNDLKAAVAARVRTNGTQSITGALLQSTLNSIIDQVGANTTFKGIAVSSTSPGIPDGPVFYLASDPGMYANFGDYVHDGKGTVIFSNVTGSWVATKTTMATKSMSDRKVVKSAKGGNLLDQTMIENGWIDSSGNINASTDYGHTEYIPIENGELLKCNITAGSNPQIVLYDANKQFISSVPSTRGQITGTETSKFVRWSIQYSLLTTNSAIYSTTIPSTINKFNPILEYLLAEVVEDLGLHKGGVPGEILIQQGIYYIRCTIYDPWLLTFNVKNKTYTLPYIQRTIDGAELLLQNGLMSFIYLHPNFWTYDLPSTDVTINEDEYAGVYGVERKKKQKVAFPSLDDPNPLQLIKTYLGDGQIEKLSVNLQSRMNDIELKYDTE